MFQKGLKGTMVGEGEHRQQAFILKCASRRKLGLDYPHHNKSSVCLILWSMISPFLKNVLSPTTNCHPKVAVFIHCQVSTWTDRRGKYREDYMKMNYTVKQYCLTILNFGHVYSTIFFIPYCPWWTDFQSCACVSCGSSSCSALYIYYKSIGQFYCGSRGCKIPLPLTKAEFVKNCMIKF